MNELKHYRTPGSKNGIRLYQNPDGSLTPLGERRYLKGEKNKSHYYDQKYKPGALDFYGKTKQKELNDYKKQVGMKSYKGYERAESNTQKISDPKQWNSEFHKKLDYSKPAKIRERMKQWREAEEKLAAFDANEAAKREARKNFNTPLDSISEKDVLTGLEYASAFSSGIVGGDLVSGLLNAYQYHKLTQNKKESESIDEIQVLPRDKGSKGGRAWADILVERYFKK